MQVAGYTRAFLAGLLERVQTRNAKSKVLSGHARPSKCRRFLPRPRQQSPRVWSTRRTGRFIIRVKVRAASICLGSIVAWRMIVVNYSATEASRTCQLQSRITSQRCFQRASDFTFQSDVRSHRRTKIPVCRLRNTLSSFFSRVRFLCNGLLKPNCNALRWCVLPSRHTADGRQRRDRRNVHLRKIYRNFHVRSMCSHRYLDLDH